MSWFQISLLVEGFLIFLALGNIGETLEKAYKTVVYKYDLDEDDHEFEVG